MKSKRVKRRDDQPPRATAGWGWRFHHLGIPTDIPRSGEKYLPRYGMHVSGFESSPFGIEWMRFDPDSEVAEIIRQLPHLAFTVDDLDAAVKGRELIGKISSPSPGVRVAMFEAEGAVIELLEFTGGEDPGS